MTIKRNLLVGLVFATSLSLASTNAFAAVPSTTVTAPTNVTLQDISTSNFTSVLLDGLRQTVTFTTSNMTLVDARGTGAGWSVNLTSTQFTNDSATVGGGALKTLPVSSLLLGTVSIVADADATPITGVDAVAASSGVAAVAAVAAITIATGTIDKVGGVKIFDNPINGGMGTYVVSIGTSTLTLLPKHAKAGTYIATITLTLSQGPGA